MFVLLNIDGVHGLLVDAQKHKLKVHKDRPTPSSPGARSRPTTPDSPGGDPDGSRSGSAAVKGEGKSESSRDLVSAKSSALVEGLLELEPARGYLRRILHDHLAVSEASPLHRVSMLSLDALSTAAEIADGGGGSKGGGGGGDGSVRVVKCMQFTILLGVLYAAKHRGELQAVGAGNKAADKAADEAADKVRPAET